MAVNGVEIEVGQVWENRVGTQVSIEEPTGHAVYPWSLSTGHSVTLCGKLNSRSESGLDLMVLRSPRGAVGINDDDFTRPEPEQRSNPKDAIGDKKLPLHLLSPIAEAHWAIGQYAGLLKYGAWNWRVAGVRSSVYISAARRHLAAYLSGEEFDPTDGSHHLGNVMACAAILLEAREMGKLTDDRPPSYGIRSTYKWAEDQMATLKVQYAGMSPRHYTIADSEAPK